MTPAAPIGSAEDKFTGSAAYPQAVTPSPDAELEVRLAGLRAGFWLGWMSIAAVAAGLALGLPVRERLAVGVLTAAAALAHAAAMLVPWRRWLTVRRGQWLLDLWSAAIIGFVALAVALAGGRAELDLLFFLVVPFLATAHAGRRRAQWLGLAALAYVGASAAAPAALDEAQVVTRAVVLAAATTLALLLARVTRREARARAEASARAELEHALLAESHHRVKNSLQTIADILLLARPTGEGAAAFEQTAERIRAIAAVHRLLSESRGDRVDARELLATLTAAAGVEAEAEVEVDPVALEPARAQQLGIVANELITNAARHGRPPVSVELRARARTVLLVRDAGPGPHGAPERLGLQLVHQIVGHGLDGTFSLESDPRGGTRARVEIPADADSRR